MTRDEEASASAKTKCRLFVVLHLDNNFALVTIIDRKTAACAMVALQADFIVTVHGAGHHAETHRLDRRRGRARQRASDRASQEVRERVAASRPGG